MVVPIGVHPNVIYIDDRDIIGINVRDSDLDNEHAGGLWVYSETGVKKDLQRGGVHFLLGQAGNDAGFQDACLQGTAGERDDIVF